MSAERENWAPAFERHLGMQLEAVLGLSDTEFANQRDYLESEGISPGAQPPVNEALMNKLMMNRLKKMGRERRAAPPAAAARPVQRPRRALTAEQQAMVDEHLAVQREQDDEYQRVLAQAQAEDAAAAKKADVAEEAEEAGKIEESEPEPEPEPEIELGPEPSDGILLAVNLPDQSRVSRKFAVSDPGSTVISWVRVTGGISSRFQVVRAGGGLLIDVDSLETQGIKGRTLFNVVLLK